MQQWCRRQWWYSRSFLQQCDPRHCCSRVLLGNFNNVMENTDHTDMDRSFKCSVLFLKRKEHQKMICHVSNNTFRSCHITVLWTVTLYKLLCGCQQFRETFFLINLSSFDPEDWDSKFLWNFGNQQKDCMMSQPGRS
jgi:hypothetical protein